MSAAIEGRDRQLPTRAHRGLKRLLLLGVLLSTPAAAGPPSAVLSVFGTDDLRSWNRPLWMEEMPSEPPLSLTEQELSGGAADESEEEHEGEDDRQAPRPVLKPYAPGDPVSVGEPNRGYLVDGVALEADAHTLVRPGRNFGTLETVNAIRGAIAAVNRKFPEGTHPLVVGDLSREKGGRFPPHKSHQSGRDVDIGYYHTDGAPQRLARVWPQTMDAGRTWALVEGLLADDQVQYMFIDYRLQAKLYEYARDVAGVPQDKLDAWFSYPQARVKRGAPIRHLKGHADHIHVRFWSPQAVANFQGYVEHFGEAVLEPVPTYYAVRRGDSLNKIAKKFRLDIKGLRKMNRLRGNALKPGQKLVVGYRRPPLPRTR
ncbi:MAG: penicillin-insensitive murein endopeptidase [bacterium]